MQIQSNTHILWDHIGTSYAYLAYIYNIYSPLADEINMGLSENMARYPLT